MKIWNPVAFFISLIMSIVMALIFSYPQGMPVWLCFALWPIRWPVAYFFSNFICNPIGFKLAVKVFNFRPGQIYKIKLIQEHLITNINIKIKFKMTKTLGKIL